MRTTSSSRRSFPAIATTAVVLSFGIAHDASAAVAGDWYVDASVNCAKGDGSAEHPFCTIDEAASLASDGDTIHVAPGTYDDFTAADKSITIVGTGGSAATSVDPGGFYVLASVSFEVRGFSFVDTRSGVGFIAPADLKLVDCVFDGDSNYPTDVIFMVAGSSLVAEQCSFLGAGRVHCVQSDVTLVDCVVSDVNHQRPEGGGICAVDSMVHLVRTQVLRCEAENSGGGIYVEGGSIDLVDCAIEACRAGRPFPNPMGRGAGIAAKAATVSASGTSFRDNQMRLDNGAGRPVCGGGCALLGGSSLHVDGCSFVDNVAEDRGGAVYADATSTFTAEDCSFVGNDANRGGAIDANATTLERCVFEDNAATPAGGTYGLVSGSGAACNVLLGITATDCRFVGNEAFPGSGGGAGSAGLVAESIVATRCVFEGNVSHAHATLSGGYGAAFLVYDYFPWGGAPTLFTDCAIVGNVAEACANASVGGIGGGGVVGVDHAEFVRCTIAGNVAQSPASPPTSGATGGGLSFIQNALSTTQALLDHTIVAGNVAALGGPDIHGTCIVTTLDWNCIGDTTDANLVGSGPHDLLDVDPAFVDAAHGDYSLAAASPCVDSGNPAVAPSGKDVASFPRLLDGDLDKTLEIDRGAREFSHVALAITGNATPGGTITVDSTGTIGMATLLIAGVAESELPLRKLGALFVDLSQLNVVLAWPPLESSVDVDLDPTVPVPLTFFVQELAVAAGAGNLSNLVRVDIE